MNKNAFGQETKWSLWSISTYEQSKTYFWVDEQGIVRFERSTAPYGWMQIPDNSFKSVGENFKKFRKDLTFDGVTSVKFTKISSHKMRDEHLVKGWLLL